MQYDENNGYSSSDQDMLLENLRRVNITSITEEELTFIDDTAARLARSLGAHLSDYERQVRRELLNMIRETGDLSGARALRVGRGSVIPLPIPNSNYPRYGSLPFAEDRSGLAVTSTDKELPFGPWGEDKGPVFDTSSTLNHFMQTRFPTSMAGKSFDSSSQMTDESDPIAALRRAIRTELLEFNRELVEASDTGRNGHITSGSNNHARDRSGSLSTTTKSGRGDTVCPPTYSASHAGSTIGMPAASIKPLTGDIHSKPIPEGALIEIEELQRFRGLVPEVVWKEYGITNMLNARKDIATDAEMDSEDSPMGKRARRPTKAAAPEVRSRSAGRRGSYFAAQPTGSPPDHQHIRKVTSASSPNGEDAFGPAKRGSVTGLGCFSRSSSLRKAAPALVGRHASIALSTGGQSQMSVAGDGNGDFPLPPEAGIGSTDPVNFLRPSDLIPFFSFRRRNDDIKQLSKDVEAALRSLRAQRLELVSGALVSASTAPLVTSPVTSSDGGLASARDVSGSSAGLLPPSASSDKLTVQRLRSQKLQELKILEKAIADAEKLMDDMAAETLEHEDARAAMLRCANTEARALELDLAAIDAKIKTAAPYCDFLAQQTIEALREMNSDTFDEERYEQQQKHVAPADMFTRYAQRAGNTHADNSQQVTDMAITSNFSFSLQLLRSLGIRDTILDGELMHIWRLAQLSSHCETVMGRLVRCHRCGRGCDAELEDDTSNKDLVKGSRVHRRSRVSSPTSAGPKRSFSEVRHRSSSASRSQSPNNTRQFPSAQSSGRRPQRTVRPTMEFYTMIPCGHDSCGQCTAQMSTMAEEGAPRQCAVCGEMSFIHPVLNVALTSIAQRLRFQRSGLRQLEAAGAEFQQALALQAADT